MQRNLKRLAANTYDVLVIGGGIYGVSVAWDAAQRGLSVALVDKGDFGHSTSSNSLRVIHGGLRYLQHGDVRRLRHSIQERTTFMRIAPHLVSPLPFLIPTYGHAMRGREILAMALLINNIIGYDRNRVVTPDKYLPSGKIIGRKECLRRFPLLASAGITGGALVHDCQVYSSERLIVSFARAASGVGADLANYLEVCGLLRDRGRVAGARVKDGLSGEEIDIRAKIVVNSSGPWVDRVLRLWDGRKHAQKTHLSKAFNLMIGRQLVPACAVGVYTRSAFRDRDALVSKGSRLLFLTPWHESTLAGTVHLPYDCNPDECRVNEEEIQAFISEINDACPAAELRRDDVRFTYAGLLPMTENGGAEVQLVKHYRIVDHAGEDGIQGLLSILGVKLTEARHVAEKTTDIVFRKLGWRPPRSRTASTPLYGGNIPHFSDFVSQEEKQQSPEMSKAAFRRLLHLYGAAYPEVLKYRDEARMLLATANDERCTPGAHWPDRYRSAARLGGTSAAPHSSQTALTAAEVLHSVREEMARKLADVVFRRTSLALSAGREDDSLSVGAAVMSRELNWDGARTQREINEVKAAYAARA